MNAYESREAWLKAATDELCPLFANAGAELPIRIRFAIAFPSTGRRGKRIGECWDQSASGDGHFEIFIRADYADPNEVLAILVHELVHSAVGLEAKHGKAFKRLALAVGLTGPMRSTVAGARLLNRLTQISKDLGPLPHAKLGWGLSNRPPKQDTRMLKVECATCGYVCRVARKWLDEVGLPLCPEHGVMVCEATAAPEPLLLAA